MHAEVEVCGEDNCPETEFEIRDGRKFCIRGHEVQVMRASVWLSRCS